MATDKAHEQAARDTKAPCLAGPKPGARGILACLALSTLLPSLGISIVNVALPNLTRVFNASLQQAQWVVLAYLLALTSAVIGMGRLGDVFGHRRTLRIGIAVFALASALCAMAPTLWFLMAARAGQGLGAAILMALTLALVRETISGDKIGQAMGILGTMSAIGTALGPSLGGILIAAFGWQAIFVLMVPLAALALVLAHVFLPPDRQPSPMNQRLSALDAPGLFLLAIALAAYAWIMTVGADQTNSAMMIVVAIFLAATILFVANERRARLPLIDIAMLRGAALNGGLAMNVCVSTVMMATLVVGPFFLAGALGLQTAQIGLVMSVGPIMSTLSGIPSGRLVDRLGAASILIIGLGLMLAGSLALSILPNRYGVTGYIAAIIILTPGYQLFQAANNTSVMMAADAAQRGVTSGLLGLSRNLGLITGAAAMGAVFAASSGSQGTNVAFGMQVTFLAAAALVAIALILALALALRFQR